MSWQQAVASKPSQPKLVHYGVVPPQRSGQLRCG